MPRRTPAPITLLLLAGALACAGPRRNAPAPPAPPAPVPAQVAPPAPVEAFVPRPGQEPRRLDFQAGEPTVPVRLMQGNVQVTFASKGRLALSFTEGGVARTLPVPPGSEWRIRLLAGTPAEVVARIQVVEVPWSDKVGMVEATEEWAQRGLALKAHVLGGVFGIAGKVVDNRRYALVVDQPPRPPSALEAQQTDLLTRFAVRTSLLEDVTRPGTVEVGVLNEQDGVVAQATGAVRIASPDGAPIEIRRVEHDVGYASHGFDDRAYRGVIEVTADTRGKLAVINLVPLEALLKGLVPSEIFARAHVEALKAQAVTARGEVLAKVGLKHLADPYLLCTEQHCAVYKGLSGEAATTSAAVDATRGEALFSQDGRLVDSVYSALCGGHTEDNEIVWGGVPNPSLRGRPDVLPGHQAPVTPATLSAFLATEAAHACRLSTFTNKSKFRWEKRFTAAELNEKVAALGVGPVMAMKVTERGVSGRARLLTISGEAGATQVRGELNMRRLFGMLNSGLFEVRPEKDARGRPAAWTFAGGGWGHGVGMCQTGAIGRAEAGQTYRQILSHYYNGAQVAPLY